MEHDWKRMLGAAAMALLAAGCGGGDDAGPEATTAVQRQAVVRQAAPAAASEVTLTALPDDVDVPNPDRGFYRWASADLDTLTSPSAIASFEADADEAYATGYRILYARVRLDAWRSTATLPSSLFSAVAAGFAAAERSGGRLLLRFTYNDGFLPGTTVGEDAPLPIVLAHLKQVRDRKLLRNGANGIAFVQAGFIGAWGEWHGSSSGLDEPGAMVAVRDAVMAALGRDQFLQMRNPQHMMALDHQSRGRGKRVPIGIHNDCFLASDTDVGTYSSDIALGAQQRAYVAALGRDAPFGAETCWPPEPAQARMACSDIAAEGRRYALTYLNAGYYAPFMARWQADGCYDRVRASMGYRLRLKSATLPAQVQRGQAVSVPFTIDNAGWARVYKPHAVTLLLRHRANGYVATGRSHADPTDWLPGEGAAPAYAETARTDLPSAAPAGTYDVCIGLPSVAQPGDARFAIRPANADAASAAQRWDAALGAFCVGTTNVL
jgi:hypothetical protein